MKLPFETDGLRFVIPLALAVALLFAVGQGALAWVCLGLLAFVIWFFRDPEREGPQDDTLLVAPADGTVARVDTAYYDQQFPDGAVCVSIFLSIFNVHVQRAPISGEVVGKRYNKGKYMAAWNHKASMDNEQNVVTLATKYGNVAVKQIAGLVARRIVCRVKVGGELEKGARLGLIRFGSRVDLITPKGTHIISKVGDKVKGGQSVMARFSRETP